MVPLVQKRLHEAVVGRLLQEIAAGKYQPGTLLPTEAEMSKSFGVSRWVVREGIRLLGARGLVQVHHGRGTVVAAEDRWDKLDPKVFLALFKAGRSGTLVGDFIQVRRMLEVEAAGLAAINASEADITRLREILGSMSRTLNTETGYLQYLSLEDDFHACIWDGARNLLLRSMLTPLAEVITTIKLYSARETKLANPDNDRDHRAVVEAVSRRDPAAAREAMARDIDGFEWILRRLFERGVSYADALLAPETEE